MSDRDYWYPPELASLKIIEDQRRREEVRRAKALPPSPATPKPFNFGDVAQTEDKNLFSFPVAPTNR